MFKRTSPAHLNRDRFHYDIIIQNGYYIRVITQSHSSHPITSWRPPSQDQSGIVYSGQLAIPFSEIRDVRFGKNRATWLFKRRIEVLLPVLTRYNIPQLLAMQNSIIPKIAKKIKQLEMTLPVPTKHNYSRTFVRETRVASQRIGNVMTEIQKQCLAAVSVCLKKVAFQAAFSALANEPEYQKQTPAVPSIETIETNHAKKLAFEAERERIETDYQYRCSLPLELRVRRLSEVDEYNELVEFCNKYPLPKIPVTTTKETYFRRSEKIAQQHAETAAQISMNITRSEVLAEKRANLASEQTNQRNLIMQRREELESRREAREASIRARKNPPTQVWM